MITSSISYRMMACTCHILTKNDEGTIRDCLDTAIFSRLFARILVLLDTKSTDSTFDILSEYAPQPEIRILPYNWADPQDFAAARNYCISLTETPYAFWLDSDEILRKPNELMAMQHRANGQAFKMMIVSPMPSGGFHNLYQPRLFPTVPGARFECPVFERLDWSLERSGVPFESTKDSPIYHPGYYDHELLVAKNVRNMRIMRKYLTEHRANDVQREHILTQFKKLGGDTDDYDLHNTKGL